MSQTGLTEAQAQERLRTEGFNDPPSAQRRSGLALAWDVVREPMFALLLGAAVLYALIGDLGDALVLAGFATASVSIAVIQRGRSERVLEALRDLSSPRALVIRDGRPQRIPGREVARGDLLLLAEGDRVPADAILVEGTDVRVDESALTGESVPVRKQPAKGSPADKPSPGGDDTPYLFSGTLMLGGTGRAVVTATGVRSEMGKIGREIEAIEPEQPRLQAQTRRLVITFGSLSLVVSALAVVLYGVLRDDWLHALLAGIALGMSLLPEEFPLVITVFTVMGAWRLSRSRVLTRKAAAIETLGAATVLCTDKTGTLTRNSMSVVCLKSGDALWTEEQGEASVASRESLAALLRTAVLASDADGLDPMERAIHELARRALGEVCPERVAIRTYPLRPELLAVTQVWQAPRETGAAESEYIVAAKGAPEAIARLCRLDPQESRALTAAVDELARNGMRVLGVASGRHAGAELPPAATDLELRFMGLLGLADPLRESVRPAVRECRSAGIRVVMITGDYPETARAIARQAGIDDTNVMTGPELTQLSEAEFAARARSIGIFARITPTQKLRIVEALKAAGEVVAMTGDGVNDAPALKAAHIGIAMGGRGTDVAREASSIVLLDDDFGAIVGAIRLGRRIYDNLRKAMAYILAIHVPIAGLALLPILMGWPLLLTPVLIALLELVIDPACSIVLEAEREERDVMQRPPRDPHSTVLPRPLALWGILQGLLAFAAATSVYVLAMRRGLSEQEVRAVALVSLIAANVALVFVSRSFSPSVQALLQPNPSLGWGLAIVLLLLAGIFGWPLARDFFGLAKVQAGDVALCIAVALALLWTLELLKRHWRRILYA